MKRNILRRIQIVYGVLLSVSLLTAGICLMAGCLVIYSSGDTPYSAQKVAEIFSAVAVPVCVFPVLALLGIFLLKSVSAKSGKRSLSSAIIMGKDLSGCDDATLSAVKKETAGRKNRTALLLGISLLGGAIFLIYALLFAGGGEPGRQLVLSPGRLRHDLVRLGGAEPGLHLRGGRAFPLRQRLRDPLYDRIAPLLGRSLWGRYLYFRG